MLIILFFTLPFILRIVLSVLTIVAAVFILIKSERNLLHTAWWSFQFVQTNKSLSHSFDVFVKDNDESGGRLFTGPPTQSEHSTQHHSAEKETNRIKECKVEKG